MKLSALAFALLLVCGASAAPAAVATKDAPASAAPISIASTSVADRGGPISRPAAVACAAKQTPAAYFSEVPTCGECSDAPCRGEYVDVGCGFDEQDRILVCQNQQFGCYPQSYPESISCRCAIVILP